MLFGIHKSRVFLESCIIARLRGLLKRNDCFWAVKMVFGIFAAPELVISNAIQMRVHSGKPKRVVSLIVMEVHIVLDFFERNAFHAAHRVRKISVDDVAIYAHRLKNLRGLIRLNRGNAHFRRNFDDSIQNCLVVILDCGVIILVQNLFVDEFSNALVRQIRIDCARSVSQNHRGLMHIAHLRALKDNGNRRAFFRAD